MNKNAVLIFHKDVNTQLEFMQDTDQTTNRLLMVRPKYFRFNEQTARTNALQHQSVDIVDVAALSIDEYDSLVQRLCEAGVEVFSHENDSSESPDALFPNNWFSTHGGDQIVLYPLCHDIRRNERQLSLVTKALDSYNDSSSQTSQPRSIWDLSAEESNGLYLEGTGSLVLDRVNRIAYASLSQRTSSDLVLRWCQHMDYQAILFHTSDNLNQPVYHTNVVMSVGSSLAVICLDVISSTAERGRVEESLARSGHRFLAINYDQMLNFCANILELKSVTGQALWAMSTRAYNSFDADQLALIEEHGHIIHSDISTIENVGGGGVRCMIAELF